MQMREGTSASEHATRIPHAEDGVVLPKGPRTSLESAVQHIRRASSTKKRKRDVADFIDPAFFLSHEKPGDPERAKLAQSDAYLRVGAGDNTSQLEQAVLDLVEDERDGVRKARSILKWDQKKRKYVREQLGHTGACSRRQPLIPLRPLPLREC
jgi:hypothetical protein